MSDLSPIIFLAPCSCFLDWLSFGIRVDTECETALVAEPARRICTRMLFCVFGLSRQILCARQTSDLRL